MNKTMKAFMTSMASLLAAAALMGFGLIGCDGPAASSDTDTQTTASSRITQATQTTQTTQATTTTTTTTTTVTTPDGSDKAQAVADLAKSLVGSAYRYGAAGPAEFDNSGFLFYCYAQNGITVPRRTRDIAAGGTAVERDSLQPGDAVFFWSETPGAVEYAGIYIGDNQFVASNNEEKPVSVYSLTLSYFTEHYVAARRYSA